ncbi:MAG TPA: CopG family ribbon-helix-helix protein [Gammaproteobacteria bacterium]|nr:CopG family ribbon-helix-helix protein [Gammaproteobacteria bacterium]
MPTTSIKLDDETKIRMKRLAEARGRSPHWMMREAISQYLTREEARESFKQEALASWAEYRETGEYVTAEEAGAWLRKWGSRDEADAPRCHK